MRSAAGVVLLAASTLVGGTLLFIVRDRRSPVFDIVFALCGSALGFGGLLLLDDVGAASWWMAPAFLAAVTPLHVRALFRDGGPLRI